MGCATRMEAPLGELASTPVTETRLVKIPRDGSAVAVRAWKFTVSMIPVLLALLFASTNMALFEEATEWP